MRSRDERALEAVNASVHARTSPYSFSRSFSRSPKPNAGSGTAPCSVFNCVRVFGRPPSPNFSMSCHGSGVSEWAQNVGKRWAHEGLEPAHQFPVGVARADRVVRVGEHAEAEVAASVRCREQTGARGCQGTARDAPDFSHCHAVEQERRLLEVYIIVARPAQSYSSANARSRGRRRTHPCASAK